MKQLIMTLCLLTAFSTQCNKDNHRNKKATDLSHRINRNVVAYLKYAKEKGIVGNERIELDEATSGVAKALKSNKAGKRFRGQVKAAIKARKTT